MDDHTKLETRLDALRKEAELAESEGMIPNAMEACKSALELIALDPDSDVNHRGTEFRLMLGNLQWDAGDIVEALRIYQEAAAYDPDSLDAEVAVGMGLFHLCRFKAARVLFEKLTAEAPEIPEAWYYLALCAERAEDQGLARQCYRRAAQLEPREFPMPVTCTRQEIADLLADMIDKLPKPLAKALENVPIVLDDAPSDEILFDCDPPLDPLLLGLFVGTPLPEQSVFSQPAGITQILIFQRNIERMAGDREELERELWITLKHEIGHFWGLDEDDLAARGLA